ncbi:L-2-amino-thiazoline-4-carboxylic acid hydrolase [Ktedonosporobacter rubrisoli]|nr:L-2-amino-thiazoline-4-carboxylic acid hydrolase [Ktedonosporobacter rubrisoli]
MSEYVVSPENSRAEIEAVIAAFLGELERAVAQRKDASELMTAIQAKREELALAYQDRAVDEYARYNLQLTSVVLAAYQVLGDVWPHAELIALLRHALIDTTRAYVQQMTASSLDQAADPFKTMVAASKAREAHFFGAGFHFERERDDDQAYLLNVRSCFYHNFFVDHEAPELTPLFCDYDANWIEAIDPARHGLRFERPTTIGYGGKFCPFHFYRTERGNRQ